MNSDHPGVTTAPRLSGRYPHTPCASSVDAAVTPNLNEYGSLRFGGRGKCWFERANTFKDKRPNTFNDKRY